MIAHCSDEYQWQHIPLDIFQLRKPHVGLKVSQHLELIFDQFLPVVLDRLLPRDHYQRHQSPDDSAYQLG